MLDAGAVSTAAVEGALRGLAVNEDSIREIMTILEQSETELHGGHPGQLSAAYLGGGDKGALLGHHTSIAHRHVVEAMEQMVVGLRGYQSNVKRFHRNVDLSDTTSGQNHQRISTEVNGVTPTVDQSTDCTSAPDVQENPSCTIPTGGDS